MQNILLILLVFLSLAACSKKHYTVIKAVDVFDGEIVHSKVDFAFSNEGIAYISQNKRHGKNSTIIDGSGKTIVPPMINAHVHVRSSENLKEALSAGIFGMLDMFSTDERANRFRGYNDSLEYARFYSSNVGATPPGGHGTQFGFSIPTINDSISPGQFVKDRLEQKADYIKITHELSMSRLDSSKLKEVIQEAHKNRLITIAHASDLDNAKSTVYQNIDGLAHLWYRNKSLASASDLRFLKDQGVFIIPTLSVIEKLIQRSSEIGRESNYLSMEEVLEEVKKLVEVGIPILAGTDSPNFNMDYTSQFFEELILLQEAGLPDIEVLKSASTKIYDAFGLKEFERLEAKSKASFILVEGKPHENIADIKNKKRVWKNGVEIV